MAFVCGFLLLAYPTMVHPQLTQAQPSLNTVIENTLKAESAGAQPDEMGRLIGALNAVLKLQDQLNGLGPQDSSGRQQVQQEINTALANVDSEANQIAVNASQRTFTEHIVAYVLGGVGALIATIATFCAFMVRRLARRKRVLHLRIVPKEGWQD